MPRRPRDAEVVEIVPLDGFTDWSVDDDAPAPPSAPPTGSSPRRNAALAMVAVLGVVAAGVWLATTESTSETAATTSTTTPPTSTTAPTTGVAPGTASINLIIPDIPGLQPYLAENPAPPDPGQQWQLWFKDQLTWILVDAMPLDELPTGTPDRPVATPTFDGAPRLSNGWLMVGSLRDPGLTTVHRQLDRWTLSVRASNVPDEQLAAFLWSLQIRRTGPDFDGRTLPEFRPSAGDGPALRAITGQVRSRTAYWSVAARQLITIEVGDPSSSATGSMDEALLDGIGATEDGRVFGRLADDPTRSLVRWDLPNGQRASATAALPPDQLLALTARARPADEQRWRSLVYGLRPDYRVGGFTTVGFGEAGAAVQWQAGLQRAERRGFDEFLWWWTVPGTDASVSAPAKAGITTEPRYTTVVYDELTYVFVSSPADVAGSAVVQLEGPGEPVVDVPVELRQPFVDLPLRAGVVAISDARPFTVYFDDGTARTPLPLAREVSLTIDVPANFALESTRVIDTPPDRRPYELWARSTEEFFTVTAVPTGTELPLEIGGDGRRTIRGATWDIVLDTVGLDADTTNALEESVAAVSGRPVFRETPFDLGFTPVVNGDSMVDTLIGEPLLFRVYRNAETDEQFLAYVGVERLDTAAVQPYVLAGLQRGQRPDREGSWVGGSLREADSENVAMLQWSVGGLQYTLLSDAGLPLLIDLLPGDAPPGAVGD